jgi:hypothetical protein
MKLTQKKLREIFDYDATGRFIRKVSRGGWLAGTIAGTVRADGYVKIEIGRRSYYGHHLAWLYVYGTLPKGSLDHRDGNRANNAITNLRLAAYALNARNRRVHKNKVVGLKGVTKLISNTGAIRFQARITVDKKTIHLGSAYKTPEQAHAAYCAAATAHFGVFACHG